MTTPTPDESASRVVEGVLGKKWMTFMEFRAAMEDEHPEYLTDDELHDLYVKHMDDLAWLRVGQKPMQTSQPHEHDLPEFYKRPPGTPKSALARRTAAPQKPLSALVHKARRAFQTFRGK